MKFKRLISVILIIFIMIFKVPDALATTYHPNVTISNITTTGFTVSWDFRATGDTYSFWTGSRSRYIDGITGLTYTFSGLQPNTKIGLLLLNDNASSWLDMNTIADVQVTTLSAPPPVPTQPTVTLSNIT